MHVLLTGMKMILLEHSAVTHIVSARPSTAIQEISLIAELVQRTPAMFANYEAQMHTLLVRSVGVIDTSHFDFYRVSMRCN